MKLSQLQRGQELKTKIENLTSALQKQKLILEDINEKLEREPKYMVKIDSYIKGNYAGAMISGTILRSGTVDNINEINFLLRKYNRELEQL